MLKWFAIPFSSGPYFVKTLHHDLSVLGGPTCMGCSFIESDKAVTHVISLVSFLLLCILSNKKYYYPQFFCHFNLDEIFFYAFISSLCVSLVLQ